MKIVYKNFEIKASFIGDMRKYNDSEVYYNHMIKIINLDTHARTVLEYWDKIEIDDEILLLNGFLQILYKASIGMQGFNNYLKSQNLDEINLIDELKKKYNSYFRKFEKIYRKLNIVFDGDISELISDIECYINDNDLEHRKLSTKFELEKPIEVLSESIKGWNKELNLISWNEQEGKYEIRDWNSSYKNMGRCLTFTSEELKKLRDILNEMEL